MAKKRNNNSSDLADWTTPKLKKYAIEYNDLIYGNNPCYGTKDIILLDRVLDELFDRGIEPDNQLKF